MSREEKRDATGGARWPLLVITFKFICRERSSPDRFAKISFGGHFSSLESRRDARASFSRVFENQDAAIVEMDFRGFTCLSLVEPVWVRLIGIVAKELLLECRPLKKRLRGPEGGKRVGLCICCMF